MNTTACILIASAEPMRLVAAWPLLAPADRRPAKLYAAWSALAGVREFDAQRFGPGLMAAGICLPDGSVAPEAVRFIESRLLGKGARAATS